MLFEMKHRFLNTKPVKFSELNAPDWLTCVNTIKGSTMDCRWFWNEHVLTLKINESVNTDVQTITRIA